MSGNPQRQRDPRVRDVVKSWECIRPFTVTKILPDGSSPADWHPACMAGARPATVPRDVVGVCQTCGHEWRCVAWEQAVTGDARLDTPTCPRCGAEYDKLYCRELLGTPLPD